jgi:hypothetical protein
MSKYLLNPDKILSFLISVFVIVLIIDPTNTILKVKNIVFLLLVGYSILLYPRLKVNAICTILAVYAVVVISFIIGNILTYKFNYGFSLGVLKGFSPLVLLFWIDKYKIINKFLFPSVVICFIVIFTFLSFLYVPTLANFIHKFSTTHDLTIIMSRRSFLGVPFLSLFYKSSPLLIIPASIFSYRLFNKKGTKCTDFIIMSLILITLFLGGTRANMLAALLIVLVNLLIWLSRSTLGKLIIIPMFAVFITAFSVIIILLMSDKNESSIKIKYADLDSYSELIAKHPTVLLFGQGAGSQFYSFGRNKMVEQTELSYLEIFRMFGLIGAIIIIMLFVFPLYIILKKRKILKYWIPMFVGYLLYLFVGGTNPFLLGSTGMLVLLAAYSYSMNPYYELHEW